MRSQTSKREAALSTRITRFLQIRADQQKQGNPRKRVLIPDSAHGTNPATAVIAGYEVANIKSGAQGQVDIEGLRKMVNEDVAALMITNPSTLGIYEQNLPEIAQILHSKGVLRYMADANMNALR